MIPDNLLPAAYNDACIAGGFAACPSLATDMDVWVFVPKSATLEEAREAILQHLKAERFYAKEEAEERRERSTDEGGYEISGRVLKVAKVLVAMDIHILVTDFELGGLLSSFDISTHQVALVPGGMIRGGDWTPITEPPVKLKDTPTTDARMEKIAKRYGHEVPTNA